jgi:hypothetical protein
VLVAPVSVSAESGAVYPVSIKEVPAGEAFRLPLPPIGTGEFATLEAFGDLQNMSDVDTTFSFTWSVGGEPMGEGGKLTTVLVPARGENSGQRRYWNIRATFGKVDDRLVIGSTFLISHVSGTPANDLWKPFDRSVSPGVGRTYVRPATGGDVVLYVSLGTQHPLVEFRTWGAAFTAH